jgi:hypothetical protein
MQDLNFGMIHELVIRDGEPICDPPPRRQREYRFPGDNEPRRERATADYCLKREALALFAHFDRLQNGTIDALEIRHGLPFRMTVTEVKA